MYEKPLTETVRGFFYILLMLQFKQDETAAVIILTLTELVTIPDPYYLFVFINVTTKNVVSFVLHESDDQSNYPQRYNQFTINPSVLFAGQSTGEWNYKVYQQDNQVNQDPAQSGSVIEYGKLRLEKAAGFEYKSYEQSQKYTEYNG